MATDRRYETQQEALQVWQSRLLPFMTWFIASITVVFLVMSAFDLMLVRNSIQIDTSYDIRTQLEKRIGAPSQMPLPGQAMNEAMILLEADALTQRYHQANALLMSRVWTKHLSFLTGVLMSLLGSVFILGKMSEAASNIEGATGTFKVAVSSASPGIILAVLGTALLITTLVVQAPLTVNDRPVYLQPPGGMVVGTPSTQMDKPGPPPAP